MADRDRRWPEIEIYILNLQLEELSFVWSLDDVKCGTVEIVQLEDRFLTEMRVRDYRISNNGTRREDCKSWEDLIALEMEVLENYREDIQDDFERYSTGKLNSRSKCTIQSLNIESNTFLDGKHAAKDLAEMHLKNFSDWKMPKIRFVQIKKKGSSSANSGQ